MNTVTIDDLSRPACAMLVVIDEMERLKAMGFVEGGCGITPEGQAAAHRLKAAGFEFNPGEMEACLRHLTQPPMEHA